MRTRPQQLGVLCTPIMILFAGCIDHEKVPIAAKSCPCADGFICVDGLCIRGTASPDAGAPRDAGALDSDVQTDAGPGDAGPGDAGPGDAGPGDAGPGDAGPGDAGPGDAGPGDAGPPGDHVQCVEAETGSFTAPMAVSTNEGEMVVGVTGPATNVSDPPTDTDGRLTIMITLPETGTYRIWGNVIAPTEDDDSFWVRVDGGEWNRWNQLSGNPAAIKWDQVHDDRPAIMEREFMLDMGMHTIEIHYREDGAFLDKLLITNDFTFTPAGEGPCP